MSRTLLVALVLVLGAGCSKADKAGTDSTDRAAEGAAAAKVTEVTVDQLDQLIAAGHCQPLDANGATTREREGVIPGATLLSDYHAYALSELPADKGETLVFYCANEQCGASHRAATRAVVAGYTDVKVLPAGIAGWKRAGKPATRL